VTERPIELSLPWPPKELSPNARMHWRPAAPIKSAYRQACFELARQHMAAGAWQDLPATGLLYLWADFYPPDRRYRDDDNAFASFKSGRDGVADALGINDRRFRMRPFLQDQIGGMVKLRITGGPEQAGAAA